MNLSCPSNAVSKRFALCGQVIKKHSALQKGQRRQHPISAALSAEDYTKQAGTLKRSVSSSLCEDHSGD